MTIETIALGKLLNGFFVTVVHISSLKMINETIPVYLLGACGTVTNSCGALGYLFVMGFGLGLPKGDYNPEIDNSANDFARQ